MAFAGSMIPRRKNPTYGKHARRLIPTLSSATEIEFAQDGCASILDPKGTSRQWQGDGMNASSDLLHGHNVTMFRPERLARQAKQRPRDQYRSSPSPSDSAKDGSSYEVQLSDDGFGRNTNVARKRRKVLSSELIGDQHSPVCDDDSLQKHVTAEARRDKRQIVHSPSVTSATQDPNSGNRAVKSQAIVRGGPRKGMSEASKDVKLDPKRNDIDATSVEQTKDPSVTRRQSKGLLKAKAKSHRMQNSRKNLPKTTARQMTPDTVFDRSYPREATSDTNCLDTSRTSVYQPTTPPRHTGAAGGATTPRQRELWDRLLVDNAQVRSPSSLDLFDLVISEEEPNNLHGHANNCNVSRESCQKSAALKARPKRIVDTLHHSDQDQDHFPDDCDELCGSSSSENKSEYMHSEISAADGALTMQTSPSAESQGLVSQFQNTSSNVSQTMPSLYGGSLKVTYAHQRSYLTDHDLEETAMIGLPVPQEVQNGGGYGRRRLRDRFPQMQSTKSLDEEFGDPADLQSGAMRSIHELREAGGNVRLVSELEAMLDDVGDHQPGSTSTRRSKLIDLVTKLEEPANCRLFVDQGLESRLMADIGLCNDLITHGLLVAALLQLMTFSSSTLLLTQVSDVRVVKFLIDLLGSEQDILFHARLRGNNMSKAAQANLRYLCSALLKSTAWRAGKPAVLSCHVLSLQCLEYLVRQTREAGSLSEILSAHAIRRIVATSVPSFPTLPRQVGEMSIICLELAVSILESCTISNAAECQASLWAGETLERVVGLLPLLSLWKGEGCGTSRTLTLRLYLNLTNNSPDLCEGFSTPEVIGVMFRIVIVHFEQLAKSTLEIHKTLLLDDLILSLGSLINLADLSQIARQLMMDLRYGGQSYLDVLLELFMNKSENTAEVRISSAAIRSTALTLVGFLPRRN